MLLTLGCLSRIQMFRQCTDSLLHHEKGGTLRQGDSFACLENHLSSECGIWRVKTFSDTGNTDTTDCSIPAAPPPFVFKLLHSRQALGR